MSKLLTKLFYIHYEINSKTLRSAEKLSLHMTKPNFEIFRKKHSLLIGVLFEMLFRMM